MKFYALDRHETFHLNKDDEILRIKLNSSQGMTDHGLVFNIEPSTEVVKEEITDEISDEVSGEVTTDPQA